MTFSVPGSAPQFSESAATFFFCSEPAFSCSSATFLSSSPTFFHSTLFFPARQQLSWSRLDYSRLGSNLLWFGCKFSFLGISFSCFLLTFFTDIIYMLVKKRSILCLHFATLLPQVNIFTCMCVQYQLSTMNHQPTAGSNYSNHKGQESTWKLHNPKHQSHGPQLPLILFIQPTCFETRRTF